MSNVVTLSFGRTYTDGGRSRITTRRAMRMCIVETAAPDVCDDLILDHVDVVGGVPLEGAPVGSFRGTQGKRRVEPGHKTSVRPAKPCIGPEIKP
jgi:hypothetical protein